MTQRLPWSLQEALEVNVVPVDYSWRYGHALPIDLESLHRHKASILLSDALEQDGQGALAVKADVSDDQQRVDVTVALHERHDWTLRNHVLDLAVRFGRETHTSVLCFFRGVDEIA